MDACIIALLFLLDISNQFGSIQRMRLPMIIGRLRGGRTSLIIIFRCQQHSSLSLVSAQASSSSQLVSIENSTDFSFVQVRSTRICHVLSASSSWSNKMDSTPIS